MDLETGSVLMILTVNVGLLSYLGYRKAKQGGGLGSSQADERGLREHLLLQDQDEEARRSVKDAGGNISRINPMRSQQFQSTGGESNLFSSYGGGGGGHMKYRSKESGTGGFASLGSRGGEIPRKGSFARSERSGLQSRSSKTSFQGSVQQRQNLKNRDDVELLTLIKNDADPQILELNKPPKTWRELVQFLWNFDEFKLLSQINPDGYFYLYLLKRSSLLFVLMSVWTFLILLPCYTLLNDTPYSMILPFELSTLLDHLTLADSLMNPQVVNLVLIVTVLYTAMVLHMLFFDLGSRMSSEFEFSDGQYMETYVAEHSIMIRGLNPEVDVDIARGKILTLFGQRFPKTKIVAVHVLREMPKGESLAEVKHKLDICRQKLHEISMSNDLAIFDRDRAKKTIPRFKYFPILFTKKIEAEDYYLTKKVKLQNRLMDLKKTLSKKNAGIAFVSLQEKNTVAETIDEIDVLRINQLEAEHDELNFSLWEVDQAMPASDIIWSNLNRRKSKRSGFLFQALLPCVIAFLSVFTVIVFDQEIQGDPSDLAASYGLLDLLTKYFCPLLLTGYVLKFFPKVLFKTFLEVQGHELISKQEDSLFTQTVLYMNLCGVIFPMLAMGYLAMIHFEYGRDNPYEDAVKVRIPKTCGLWAVDNQLNEYIAVTIARGQEWLLKYALQAATVIALGIMYTNQVKILKVKESFIRSGTHLKTKFKHWYHDLGFKTCVALSFLTFALTFSLVVPLLVPLAALTFTGLYYSEKYHVLYTYPMSFDSSKPLRRSLLVQPLYALLTFQALMFTICASVLSRRVAVYLVAGLALEVLVTLSVFEFSKRRPWEGREKRAEQVIKEKQDNLFDDSISSYHFGSDGNSRFNRGGNPPNRKLGDPSSPESKLFILQNAYMDPNERLINSEQHQEEEKEGLFAHSSSGHLSKPGDFFGPINAINGEEDRFFRQSPEDVFNQRYDYLADDQGTDLNVSFYDGQEQASISQHVALAETAKLARRSTLTGNDMDQLDGEDSHPGIARINSERPLRFSSKAHPIQTPEIPEKRSLRVHHSDL